VIISSLVEAVALLNTRVLVRVEGFWVAMMIHDVKSAYGRYRFLVSPVSGSGTSWVEDTRLRPMVGVAS